MTQLTDTEKIFLDLIATQLNIVADLSRAEALLYGPLIDGETRVIAHAHPHSVAPAYRKSYAGTKVSAQEMPVIIKTLATGHKQKGQTNIFGNGVNVIIETRPVFSPENRNRVIGVVSIDTSLLEQERQRARSRTFQRSLRQLQSMLTRGLIDGADTLSPFDEQSGIMVVDREGYIRYASGIAANLYRRIGYLDNLVGHHLENLTTRDDTVFSQAITTRQCIEDVSEDNGRHWIRKAIPLYARPGIKKNIRQFLARARPSIQFVGGLMILRDITEERRKEQEMRVKNAMIQEIHHRVKNNLQTIAALLRIQSRRVKHEDAVSALKDAIKRIQSVAVIHEFLSDQDAWTINIKDVCQRIIGQTQQSIVSADVHIAFSLEGPSIWLPSRQATACALVINELLQNSLEHGFEGKTEGNIAINLTDEGDHVIIEVSDNGLGLPDNFDPAQLNSLGLHIATTLVTEDLQGRLEMTNNNGTVATMHFPKAIFGGEEGYEG